MSTKETSRGIRSNEPISEADLARVTPAIMNSTSPKSTVSELYGFVPTIDLIRALNTEGFQVYFAVQIKARGENAAYCRHVVRLRKDNITNEHGLIEDIIIYNSHDRTMPITLNAGLYDPEHDTYMTLPGVVGQAATRHMKGNTVNYIASVPDLAQIHRAAADSIMQMKSIHLNQLERLQFAELAIAARFPKDRPPINPADVLSSNEVNDVRGDLWSTLIDVNNGLLNGGIKFATGRANKKTGSPKMSSTRRISNIRLISGFQKALWDIALNYMSQIEQERAAA